MIPERDDFAAVYTVLRREYRYGTSVMDAKTILKLVNQTDRKPINYIKLRYILEIMNELGICLVESLGNDLYHFEIVFKTNKTSIDKSSILKKLKSRCANRQHHG